VTVASLEAVVMAAGEGRRMRPVTERYAKSILPIDGRPVLATLLRELGRAGVGRVTVVTGHLAEQVEALAGDGAAFGLELRFVRQARPDGSADAVLRAALESPYLVLAADTVFRAGDVGRFAEAFVASGAAGAIATRIHPEKEPIRIESGRVIRIPDRGGPGPWTGAPLWGLGPEIPPYLGLDDPPYELTSACQRAIDAGAYVAAIEIGPTRDLTSPLDLVRENFPYLAPT
jgi:CTP:molybdopterin cytidylyltransferase MocA